MIRLKNDKELDAMREAGRLAAELLRTCAKAVAPGVTTLEIDALARRTCADMGVESAFLGYRGYPGCICISVNEEVIHGIPGPRVINVGDVVSLDVGVRYRGWNGDNALTVMVGVSDPAVVELVERTEAALAAGIAAVAPGRRLSDVSAAVEKVARAARLGVVREYVGHGIGTSLHEEPEVPNFGRPGHGPVLREGMVFCIEPMLNRGTAKVDVLADGWTVVTRDGRPAAHFEHEVAVVSGGVEILTPRDDTTGFRTRGK